jgi:hypothetical protein
MFAKQLVKSALALSVFFAVCISLIHMLPYNAPQLHVFLTPPEGCPMPCFMGIRPGVTTYDEALTILEGHSWVERVEATPHDAISIMQWTGKQPDFIDTNIPVDLRFSQSGTVYDIDVHTTLSAGDVRLLLGTPSALKLGVLRAPSAAIYVTNLYNQYSLGLMALVACPIGYERFLVSPARIMLSNTPTQTTGSAAWDRNTDGLQASRCG